MNILDEYDENVYNPKKYSDYDRRRMRPDLIGMIICFVAAAIIFDFPDVLNIQIGELSI